MNSPPVRSYRDLIVWQKAMDMTNHVYTLTRNFPSDERFGLVSQMRRAAVSVPSNIAEGHAREHTGEYLRHISVALGSLAELETQAMIAQRNNLIALIELQNLEQMCDEISRMLHAVQRKLWSKINRSSSHS